MQRRLKCLITMMGALFGLLTSRPTWAATPSHGATYLLADPGWLRAWSIEGPIASDIESSKAGNQDDATVGRKAAVSEVNATGVLDLNERFNLRGPGSARIVAKGSLEVAADTEGWLLIRAEGWLRVTIDGTTRLHRKIPMYRARGWDAVAVKLKTGTHTVRLDCKRLNDRWSLAAKFISNSGRVPSGTLWRVPTIAKPQVLEPFNVSLELGTQQPVALSVRINAPLGTPAGDEGQLSIQLRATDGAILKQFDVGTWPTKAAFNTPLVAQVGLLHEWLALADKAERKLELDVTSGSYRVRRKLQVTREALLAWQSATQLQSTLAAKAGSKLDVPTASLRVALANLSAALSDGRSAFEVHRAAARLQTLCDTINKGRMPWQVPGNYELGYVASADSALQPFALYVPQHPDNNSRFPLVVVLHGYNGTASKIMDAFLDISQNKPLPLLDGFVLAPQAHGNTFYRGPGERDVLELLDWALTTLPIDRDRVTITGASMGGTGTAELALHYPDHFAGQAPLCGYQSYYVRRDTSGQPLRAWEKRLMHRNSAASSAESGRYLPMNLTHGLKDRPLENSKVLTTRYQKLGYKLIQDWPNLGHAVWKKAWANAGLFPWLSAQARPQDPPRVTLAASALRHLHAYWLTVTELDSQAELATIDAEILANDRVRVTSKGVVSFELANTHRLDRARTLQIQIDGSDLTAAPNSKLHFYHSSSGWKQEPLPAGRRKREGSEGPWLDIWSEPLVFVYGTLDPATTGVNLEVAHGFADPTGGNEAAYPVVADVSYTDTAYRDKTAVFVGNSGDNAWLKHWAADLPISVDVHSIKFGGREFSGDDIGAVYVYPQPESSGRVMGVITAPAPAGLWESLSLPLLLPDFLVFDSRVTQASGEPILGKRARVLAGGFFNSDWSLPARLNDSVDEPSTP